MHNLKRLASVASATNPVAIIKVRGWNTTTTKPDNRHFESQATNSALLCVNAKVALYNKNLCQLCGLHNGACGIVKEIVFSKDRTPNNGDLPLYAVVEFPLYCGPPWDTDNPKVIPIPVTEYNCKYSNANHACCTRTSMPLCLAYARTIHKFQGMSAGPVDDGKIPNMFKCIICDPDKRESERSALGLFYTAISRATTLGDNKGKGSAIYFTGDHYNEQRVRMIDKIANSDDDYKRVKQRNRWVKHLKNQQINSSMSKKEQKQILQWAESFTMTFDNLYDHIQKYIQRNNNKNNKQRENKTKQQNETRKRKRS